MTGHEVLGVFVGQPRRVPGDPGGATWRTGLDKAPVRGRVELAATNLAGDGQADTVNHGGIDKAVCVYPASHYQSWRDRGLDLAVPAFGENLSVAADEGEVCIGDQLRVGTATVEVSQPRSPCWKPARRREVPKLAALMQRTGMTGWYLRVIEAGRLAAGDALCLVDRPHPDWTVARANEVMYHHRRDRELAGALAACPALGASWATKLADRAAGGRGSDDAARLGDDGSNGSGEP